MLVRMGSLGADVTRVQKELKAAGLDPGPIDGVFGPKTQAAVTQYQKMFGLSADGIVGNRTWSSMQTDRFEVGQASRPEPQTLSAKVKKMLSEAASYIGYREGRGNSNRFSSALGRPPEPWCADFVSYLGRKVGFNVNTASAQGVANYLQTRGTWKGRRDPQPGDAVTFRWDGSRGWADHVGLVEKVFRGRDGQLFIQTIEGNSGDQVRRKTYPAYSSVINGYGALA
jgi:peptidoglycan hydrolase-like protein with peptidoglycan-binding domain